LPALQRQEDNFFDCAENITNELGISKNVKWFIATDNEITRTRAANIYKDKIIYYNASIGRDSLEGVAGGLIDVTVLHH
jgi:hypothetical protein